MVVSKRHIEDDGWYIFDHYIHPTGQLVAGPYRQGVATKIVMRTNALRKYIYGENWDKQPGIIM